MLGSPKCDEISAGVYNDICDLESSAPQTWSLNHLHSKHTIKHGRSSCKVEMVPTLSVLFQLTHVLFSTTFKNIAQVLNAPLQQSLISERCVFEPSCELLTLVHLIQHQQSSRPWLE